MIIVLGQLGIWQMPRGSQLLIDKVTQRHIMESDLGCFAKAKGPDNDTTKQQSCESVVRYMHASMSTDSRQ